MLSSSSSSEITIGDKFTKALIDVWRGQNPAVDCLKPAELEQKVQSLVTAGTGFMLPQLAFGREILRCFALLGKRSTLLTTAFSRRPAYPCSFYFGDAGSPEYFDPNIERSFNGWWRRSRL